MELPASTPRSRSPRSPFRRRRVVWSGLLLSFVALFFLAPSSFWETSRHRAMSVAEKGKEWLPEKLGGGKSYGPQQELQDFLHMIASSELTIPTDVDPSKPLSRDVYSIDLGNVAWLQEVQPDPPVIVFSKTYCPYSKKAKELLRTYDLSPPPKIVEVDLRKDAEQIKVVLTRLTQHSTFPNVFIDGKSIGGSDDLTKLHSDGQLVNLLTEAGVSSNVNGDADVPPSEQ
ncbi:hypothetical protein ACEPAF_7747 [Sanghuangporus sanghuang]